MRVVCRIAALFPPLALACLALFPHAAVACEMCWGAGAGDNPVTQGISMAMLLLIGVTGVVGGGVGAFFLRMRRRARLLARGEAVMTEEGALRPVGENSRDRMSATDL